MVDISIVLLVTSNKTKSFLPPVVSIYFVVAVMIILFLTLDKKKSWKEGRICSAFFYGVSAAAVAASFWDGTVAAAS